MGFDRDARTRFILRHGFVPWGLVIGALAAVGGVLAARREAPSGKPMSVASALAIAALCFVVWCVIAGWVVGAIRWDLRGPHERKPPSPRPRGRQ